MKGLEGAGSAWAAIFAAMTVFSVFAQGLPPAKPKHPVTPPAERREYAGAVGEGELRLVPTYSSLSVVWGVKGEVKGLKLEYRAEGEESWREALAPVYDKSLLNYRGSIVCLKEATRYEVRLAAEGLPEKRGTARTWSSAVRIAREVVIDPAVARFPIKIAERGTPDGWIRYRIKGGRLHNATAKWTFDFDGAAYVVLEDAVLTGGYGQGAITVTHAHDLRFLNLDLSDFGLDGTPRYDQAGQRFAGPFSEQKHRWTAPNNSSGIYLGEGARAVTVERCWIHDAHSSAHSWRYSHPYGPMAIRMNDPDGNFVVRWCDITGSDLHRWDDAIGGGNDFNEKGTWRRDGDLQGCFVSFANDDAVEIDGGQQNIRLWENRFEACFMGVSVQGCTVGPSYLWRNLFTGFNHEFGGGTPIKTSGVDLFGYGPAVHIFNNTIWNYNGQGALNLKHDFVRFNVANNLFIGPHARIFGQCQSPNSTVVSNLAEYAFIGKQFDHTQGIEIRPIPVVNAAWARFRPRDSVPGIEIPNFAEKGWPRGAIVPGSTELPARPIPWALDRGRIDVGRIGAAPEPVTVRLRCGGRDYRGDFTVAKEAVADWFEVSPAKGEIRSGGEIVFRVAFRPERMKDRRYYRAAFLVRTAEGFSRPVTVYAETGFENPYRVDREGAVTLYASDGPAPIGPGEYGFDIPKKGRYYFMIRGRSLDYLEPVRTSVSIDASVDGEKPAPAPLNFQAHAGWNIVAPGGYYMSFLRYYDLEAGRHVMKLGELKGGAAVELTGLLVTDSPGIFEPR